MPGCGVVSGFWDGVDWSEVVGGGKAAQRSAAQRIAIKSRIGIGSDSDSDSACRHEYNNRLSARLQYMFPCTLWTRTYVRTYERCIGG